MPEDFEPKIVAFFCNWCTYLAADLAGTSRIKYAPNAEVVRVMCSGRIDVQFVLKAFAKGADGVLIGGCHPGDCHYQSGNYKERRRFAVLQETLDELGFDKDRVWLRWISASEGAQFAETIREFTAMLKEKRSTPHTVLGIAAE